MNRIPRTIGSIGTATLLIGGCSADRATSPGGTGPRAPSAALVPSYPTSASGWVSGISNPYLAFERGRVFNYRTETDEGLETTVVEVTRDTRTILGVVTTVVHDRVWLNGSLIEDTFDWYAQDAAGNVWYFGEDSKEIENGVVISTAGSWEAGVNGAQPGIIMLADPTVGVKYQQELAVGVAEDMARVRSLSESVEVPYGSFDNCLQTFDFTPLDRSVREYKYYARGVGLVLTTEEKGNIRDELVSVRH